MKSCFLLALIILSSSCSQNENAFGELSDADKQWIREQGAIQCKAENQADTNSFKDKSDEQYNPGSNRNFYRRQNWLYELKTGTTVLQSTNIAVWKLGTNVVYLLLTTPPNSTNPSYVYQFVKIASDTNLEMIDDLATKACTFSDSTVYPKVQASQDSSSIVYTTINEVPIVSQQKTRTTKTNTYSYTNLAFFGTYAFKQEVKTLNNDNTTTATADIVTTGTLTAKTDVDPVYTAYTDYPSAQYCVVKYTGAAPKVYDFPYTLSCATATTPDFNPTELNCPCP